MFDDREIVTAALDAAKFVWVETAYGQYRQQVRLVARIRDFLAGKLTDDEFKSHISGLVENRDEVFDSILRMC